MLAMMLHDLLVTVPEFDEVRLVDAFVFGRSELAPSPLSMNMEFDSMALLVCPPAQSPEAYGASRGRLVGSIVC